MWQLENKTPFETGCGFTKDKNGNETWIVIVKATYTINGSSELTISEEQRKVTSEPLYRGEPGESSLLYDTDFVLEKPSSEKINWSIISIQRLFSSSLKSPSAYADCPNTETITFSNFTV